MLVGRGGIAPVVAPAAVTSCPVPPARSSLSGCFDAGSPACVETCKVGALLFGELNELIKSARTQLAVRVSSAVGEIQAEKVALPDHILAWRDLGESISRAGKEEVVS